MTTSTDNAPKLSKVEHIKDASNGLLGSLPESFASDAPNITEDEGALLKHHGSYQQDNRDERAALKRAGKDKAWSFMVRTKIPGGRLTADHWLIEDELARKFSYGSLRITSRQGLQMHGIGKKNMKAVIKGLNDARMTTLGACGDVNRNTMACPVCDLDWRHSLGLESLAAEIAERFAPRSTAYFELWCDGEKWGEKLTPTREEPLYGKTYLPRKFKMAVAAPEDNCVDLYTHDLGAEAVHEGGRLLGWDLIIGGGMGFTHSKQETYARLGDRAVRVTPAEVMEVIEEIVKVQRDFGGRENRAHARLKYLLDDRGIAWFKEELFRRLGRDLPDAGPMPQYEVHDHLGWHEDRFGKLYLGLPIDNGRVQDTERVRMQSGLRELVTRHRPAIALTPLQNIIFTGIAPKDRNAIQSLLDDHGIATNETILPIRRRAMACPALPTCGLALADSERVMPGILDQLEAMGSGAHEIELRMTGCPNSCVRTTAGEIGISGRGPGKYVMHIGGSPQGTRLAYSFRETVTDEELPGLLHNLIQSWRKGCTSGERFGDWANRLGREGVDQVLANGN